VICDKMGKENLITTPERKTNHAAVGLGGPGKADIETRSERSPGHGRVIRHAGKRDTRNAQGPRMGRYEKPNNGWLE